MAVVRNIDLGCSDEDTRANSNLALRLLKQRTIMLAGEISRESAQQVISKLLLLSAENPTEPIKLFINSPGGDADAGFAMFDVIRYVPAPVEIITAGLAASAGVIVLLASPRDKRSALPNARFLIHQPSTGVQGAASDIQIEASEILKIRERINKLIADETGKTVEQVDTDTKRNYWMNSEEACAYGLVSQVITSAE